MEVLTISVLNGISYGLLLFMLSAGLALVFSLMGVLNFAHASFYMLGAYFAYSLGKFTGFWVGVAVAPFLVGLVGVMVERYGLRRMHRWGHVPELLFTFGLAYIFTELVQIFWGKAAVPYRIPALLDGPLFTIQSMSFPAYRGFMMAVSVAMLVVIWLLIARTRVGLVIRAALAHPEAVEALGHDVPRVFMLVFAGGAALAGLAGAIGGPAFATEPAMAAFVGTIIFVVVVVGGLGSLMGTFFASLIIGVVQTLAVSIDSTLASLTGVTALDITLPEPLRAIASLNVSQIAPVLPYLLMILVLVFRPRGLMGTRES